MDLIFQILYTTEKSEVTNYESGVITEHLVRIDRIIETMMGIFKDTKVPTQIKDVQLEEIKRIKHSRDILRNEMIIHKTLKADVHGIIRFLTIIPTTKFMSMLISGHLDQDYATLQNQLDSMMNNELFYQSHRLNKFIRDNK
jgi:hypothetical protein